MTIGIPYTIKFTDPSLPGKQSFQIQPGTTDGPLSPITNTTDTSASAIHTPIVLPGMGLVQYGEKVNESLVHVMENFAGCTPPVAPTEGLHWYDHCNSRTMVWNGVDWDPVGSTGTPVVSIIEYNTLANNINQVIGQPSNNFPSSPANTSGYGQNTLPLLVDTDPTEEQWITLIQTARKVGNHQGTDVFSLVDSGFTVAPFAATIGVIGLTDRYLELKSKVDDIVANRHNADYANFVSSTTSSTRSAPWIANIANYTHVEFSSADHLKSFFNAGGTIDVTPSANGSSDPQSVRWQNQLAAIGTVSLKSFVTESSAGTVNYGLYNLFDTPSTPQQIYSNNVGGAAGDTFVIRASATPGSSILTLSVTFSDNTSEGNANDPIPGNITLDITLRKPNNTYLDFPGIGFPQVNTLISLTDGGNAPADINAETCTTLTGSGIFTIPAGSRAVTAYSNGANGTSGNGISTTVNFQGSFFSWAGADNGNPNIPAAFLQTIANNVGLVDVPLVYSIAAGNTMELCFTEPLCPVPGDIISTYWEGDSQYQDIANGDCTNTKVLIQTIPSISTPSITNITLPAVRDAITGGILKFSVSNFTPNGYPSAPQFDNLFAIVKKNGVDAVYLVSYALNDPEYSIRLETPEAYLAGNYTLELRYNGLLNGTTPMQSAPSVAIPFTLPDVAGNIIGTQCVGSVKYQTVADGSGGVALGVVLDANAADCGYVGPTIQRPVITNAQIYDCRTYGSSNFGVVYINTSPFISEGNPIVPTDSTFAHVRLYNTNTNNVENDSYETVQHLKIIGPIDAQIQIDLSNTRYYEGEPTVYPIPAGDYEISVRYIANNGMYLSDWSAPYNIFVNQPEGATLAAPYCDTTTGNKMVLVADGCGGQRSEILVLQSQECGFVLPKVEQPYFYSISTPQNRRLISVPVPVTFNPSAPQLTGNPNVPTITGTEIHVYDPNGLQILNDTFPGIVGSKLIQFPSYIVSGTHTAYVRYHSDAGPSAWSAAQQYNIPQVTYFIILSRGQQQATITSKQFLITNAPGFGNYEEIFITYKSNAEDRLFFMNAATVGAWNVNVRFTTTGPGAFKNFVPGPSLSWDVDYNLYAMPTTFWFGFDNTANCTSRVTLRFTSIQNPNDWVEYTMKHSECE